MAEKKNSYFQDFQLKSLYPMQNDIAPEFIIIDTPKIQTQPKTVTQKAPKEYTVAKSGVRYDKNGVFVTYRCNFEIYKQHDPRHELPKVHLYDDCDTKTSDYMAAYEFNGSFADETDRTEDLRVCRRCLGKYLNNSNPTWKQVDKFNFKTWFAEQNRKFNI